MRERKIKMANGRPVGTAFNGRAIFPVGPRNLFRKAGGYSLDAGAVSDAAKDCRIIVLREESGTLWTIPLVEFTAQAQRIDYGHGIKLVVPLSAYSRGGGEQLSILAIPPQPPASSGHHGAGV